MKYKLGDKVKIIGNLAMSMHRIGEIGTIVRVGNPHPSFTSYLIDVNGYHDEGSTWSYESDLMKTMGVLNKKTKVI